VGWLAGEFKGKSWPPSAASIFGRSRRRLVEPLETRPLGNIPEKESRPSKNHDDRKREKEEEKVFHGDQITE